MNISEFFDPKKTKQLVCFDEYFKFFKNLINSNKLPKASLLTGTKGTGKLTLISVSYTHLTLPTIYSV